MKVVRACLVAACAGAALPAMAAVELEEGVAYLKGAQPFDPACTWEASLAGAVTGKSKGSVVAATAPATPASVRVTVEIVTLTLDRQPKGGTHEAIVRANIVRDGKLLATRDFRNDEWFKIAQPPCEALLKLGASLGESIAQWAPRMAEGLMVCGEGCTGIHPDETIVIAAEVLDAGPKAINDTVRVECKWPTKMVRRLVADFNEYEDPAPRAKLEARPIDIQAYPGRRLVLRVLEVHALGGGGFSGPKWMSLAGELHDGNALVGTFQSYTPSGRGLTTCRSVDSLTDSSIYLINQWLRTPTMGAMLR